MRRRRRRAGRDAVQSLHARAETLQLEHDRLLSACIGAGRG